MTTATTSVEPIREKNENGKSKLLGIRDCSPFVAAKSIFINLRVEVKRTITKNPKNRKAAARNFFLYIPFLKYFFAVENKLKKHDWIGMGNNPPRFVFIFFQNIIQKRSHSGFNFTNAFPFGNLSRDFIHEVPAPHLLKFLYFHSVKGSFYFKQPLILENL